MSARALSYGSYLRLDRLLSLQQPRTPRQDARVWAAERFFVVCHQVSELWAAQVLVDLADGSWFAEQGDWATARTSTVRASSMVLLLSDQLQGLLHLPVTDFMKFRDALERASGAQSQQFNNLLRGPRHPLVRVLANALAAALPRVGPDAPHRPGTCSHDECVTAAALEIFLAGILSWRRLHLVLADHFLGDAPGTGGTSGVEFLARRLAAAEACAFEGVPTGGPIGSRPGHWWRPRANRITRVVVSRPVAGAPDDARSGPGRRDR